MHAVKRLLIGTPLEAPARYVHSVITRNKNYAYDQQTLKVMRRVLEHDSCFVDVGAHKGDILRQAVRLAPHGKHWAFEPLPHLSRDLQREFPMVEIFNCALADSLGEADFTHVVSAPALSGLRKREAANNEVTETITVPTKPLDSIIGQSRVDMIKIDVEGAELPVLRGAKETISKNKPVIVFEHGLGGADAYGHTPEQVFDLLSDCGLKLFTMALWLSCEHPLSRSQFCEKFYTGNEFCFMASARTGTR